MISLDVLVAGTVILSLLVGFEITYIAITLQRIHTRRTVREYRFGNCRCPKCNKK